MEEFMLPCLNKKLFGVACFGCGAQRALALVLQGDFTAAFEMYPAIYTLIGLGFFLIVNLFYKFKYDFSVKTGLIILNAGIIFISYFIKMDFFS